VVTIEPGAVFLFRNFTGLHVQGRLNATGTREKPIIFSSEFDHDYNPGSGLLANPYDWNGVYVHDNAVGTNFSCCKILFSVYGLISDTKFIRLADCAFDGNGKSDLVIAGTQQVIASQPFSYTLSVSDVTASGVPIDILEDPAAPKRTLLRYSGLISLIGGVSVGVIYGLQWRESLQSYNELSTKDTFNLINHNGDMWENAKSRYRLHAATAIGGLTWAVLGGIGFTYSFRF
jgi:hypothetical protein